MRNIIFLLFIEFYMRIKKSNYWNLKKLGKLYKNFPLLLLMLNIFGVFQVSNFFYLITESPDYFHLSNYLKYGFGEIESTNRDLGLAYFNLTNIFISFQSNFLTFTITYFLTQIFISQKLIFGKYQKLINY